MAEFPLSFCFLWLLIILTSLQLYCTCSKPTPTGFSIRLIPSDSTESPLYPGNLTQMETMERKIRTSMAKLEDRKAKIQLLARNSSKYSRKLRFPIYRDGFYYSAEVVIGSEYLVQHLLVDTGSNTIWTQCLPCVSCFPQRLKIYNSSASSTFEPLPCSHRLCQGFPYRCSKGYCVYQVLYGGGAVVGGAAAFETFLINTAPFQTVPLKEIVFGCSFDSRNVVFDNENMISGILGLDYGPDSFMIQLGDRSIDNRFSYCIIPYLQATAHVYVLRFGHDIPHPPPGVQLQTTMINSPWPLLHYYLLLSDISVGSRRLGLPPDTFKVRDDFSGGCFIDSGAPISTFETTGANPYKAITDAFIDYYNSKGLPRMLDQLPHGLEVCYHHPPGFFNDFLSMTYHFQGADFVVEGKYMHFINDESHYFCVALLPAEGLTIFGAWQQQNMRLIYDVKSPAIHFFPEDCTRDIDHP